MSDADLLSSPCPSRVTRSLSVVAPDGLSTLSANLRPRNQWARPKGLPDAGRLRMTREFSHEPVMVEAVVEALATTPSGVIVDATLGGGGHSAALLRASTNHRVVGIDRDPQAVGAARSNLAQFGPRASVVQGRFDALEAVLAAEVHDEPLSGVLFDLGVSSPQFDESERGFSYRFEAPLDMRMDPSQPRSAATVVNEWGEDELAGLFSDNGETRFARRIARAIVAARPIATTTELADTVRAAIPAAARHRGGHPAKRVFQAVRIAVNDELAQLPIALESAMSQLAPRGRVVVISYHSGEDRMVKQAFAAAAAGWCTCPPGLPCVCGSVPALTVLTRGARLPSRQEVEANPRASSARLRIAERLDAPWRANQRTGEEA